MMKTKSTKRALLMSALALLACVSMLVGSTFAWFTDSVTSSNNKIVAGKLDVQLWMDTGDGYEDISKATDSIFNMLTNKAQNNNADTLWEPGKTQVAYLKIVNGGTLALKYSVALKVYDVEKDLHEVMQYAITPDATYGTVKAWDADNGKQVVLGTQTVTDADVAMNPGDEHVFALSIHMLEEAGNQYQEGKLNFDLTVLATQLAAEEDSFNNQYDKDAIYAEHYAGTAAGLQDAIDQAENGDTIALTDDINLNDLAASTFSLRRVAAEDPQLKVVAGKNVTINLNGHTLSATSANTGKNYDMIDVHGTLTVVNGTITTKHVGDNMAWNNSTNVFNVTAGGVLNLENVDVNNFGGSDMAIGIHLNNWGKVTLNVNNSNIYAAYCGVRAFNSGYDMNTVNITNSNVSSGNMAFWVHNYTATDFGSEDKAASQQALLNLNFVKDGAVVAEANNTFNGKIRFGFNGDVVVIEAGKQLATAGSSDTLKEALAADKDVFLNEDITFTGEKQMPDRNNYVEAYGNKVGFAQYGGVLDGNGYELTDDEGDKAYVVVTHGGTIKNVTIKTGARGIVTYSPTENVYIDNVVVDGPGYALNSTEHAAVDMFVTNSTVNGWTSLAGFKSVSFTNCKLGENSSKYWQDMGYVQDYDRLFRVYSPTTYTNCEFEQGYYLDLSVGGTATLKDCTVNGVEITAENYADYITIKLPAGKTLADCVTFA